MNNQPNSLSFKTLRGANVARLQDSKYKLCESEWTPAHWMQATVGELGELANIMKKVDRGDFTLEEARESIGKELADVQTYLDIMAHKLGVDLGTVTIDKFNEVSHRIGSPVRIAGDGYWSATQPTKKTLRLYISGPMTGYANFNKPAFNQEAARLRELGYDVVNPAELNPDDATPWQECLRNDIAQLVTCDALVMIEGWEKSNGAHLEMHIAHRVGMEILQARDIQDPDEYEIPHFLRKHIQEHVRKQEAAGNAGNPHD